MTFENLPSVPRADGLIDKAFSRAARAGRAKSGFDAQQSMLQTAANILGDNLRHVPESWPDFDRVDPFYRELADAVAEDAGLGGIDGLREHLGAVGRAGQTCADLRGEYHGRLRRAGDVDAARKLRKQAFARLADVAEGVDDDLAALAEARDALRDLPDIRPDEPTVVVAGYPNVGKSSFVNSVTNARNEVASYPFTTTSIRVGHFERDYVRYQLIDTPGLLDRPAVERNGVERPAVSALSHAADCILVFVDASGSCGYPLETQLALRDELAARFEDVPVVTVGAKADRSRDVDADHYLSVTQGEGIAELLDRAVLAVGYEPDLPHEQA
jgi:nucleolar GTP-binding protein